MDTLNHTNTIKTIKFNINSLETKKKLKNVHINSRPPKSIINGAKQFINNDAHTLNNRILSSNSSQLNHITTNGVCNGVEITIQKHTINQNGNKLNGHIEPENHDDVLQKLSKDSIR